MTWKPITTTDIDDRAMLNPSIIIQDPRCQPRVNGINPDIVAEYAESMRKEDIRAKTKENIKKLWWYGWMMFERMCCVKTDDNQYILYSGFHRLNAILEVGYERVQVEYHKGTIQDAIMLSKGVNANHGIKRTNADKEHIVISCLTDTELRKWSNEQIAKWCNVSPNTVANHEKRLCNIQRQTGEPYERPSTRYYQKPDGSIGEKDTASIGIREKKEPAPVEPATDDDVKEAIRADLNEARQASDNGNGGGTNGVKYKPIADKHDVDIELVAEIAKTPNVPPTPTPLTLQQNETQLDHDAISVVYLWYLKDGNKVPVKLEPDDMSHFTLIGLWDAVKELS